MDYLQSEQFNLIKKAVSTITSLEDLVNLSLTKLDNSGKEVGSMQAQVARATQLTEYYKDQVLDKTDEDLGDAVK